MHEMSITISMLDIVKEHMEKVSGRELKALKVRVGELTAVEPESLKFCFEVATTGTPFEGARLDIEEVPLMGRCSECSEVFSMGGSLFAYCPECQSGAVMKISGSELDIVSMEVE